jgi:uncharacterized protein YgiM (DUF1202 family)
MIVTYNQYMAAEASAVSPATDEDISYKPPPAPVPDPVSAQQETLTTGANIRSSPSAKASIIRVARKGDTFTTFGTENGWVHVGSSSAEGWIAARLLTP